MEVIGIDKENFDAVKGLFPEDTEKYLDEPEFIIYAAVDDASASMPEVSGVLAFFVERPEDENEVRIDWIFVTPDNRGRGVGSFLLEEVRKSAEAEGISLVYATLPDDDAAVESFFERNGFGIEDSYLPYFEGTVGELKSRARTTDIKFNSAIWDELAEEDEDELHKVLTLVQAKHHEEDMLFIDLSDEKKAELFDSFFEDCSVTVVRQAVYQPEQEDMRLSLNLDEALMLLNEDTPYLMPRFNALVDRISEVAEYDLGADSQVGPYVIVYFDKIAFEVKLFITLDPDDIDNGVLTFNSEFDISALKLDTIQKRLEKWENESLYTDVQIDEAYEKAIFTAAMPFEGELPTGETIVEFANSFIQEVKMFFKV